MLWTDKVKKYLLKLNIVELKDKQFTVINDKKSNVYYQSINFFNG